jgi:urease accessory protein
MQLFRQKWLNLAILGLISMLLACQPVSAHHPTGGRIPSNFFEGFLSGLAHPIVGLDHLAFVVASGSIAVGVPHGFLIPIGFVMATSLGAGIHLQGIDLPFAEGAIAISVMLFGALLTRRNWQESRSHFYTLALASFALIAGIFHGYAYGESIVGAQMATLIAYLSGFAVIQLLIAGSAWWLGKKLKCRWPRYTSIVRWMGLGIGAIGLLFLTQA